MWDAGCTLQVRSKKKKYRLICYNKRSAVCCTSSIQLWRMKVWREEGNSLLVVLDSSPLYFLYAIAIQVICPPFPGAYRLGCSTVESLPTPWQQHYCCLSLQHLLKPKTQKKKNDKNDKNWIQVVIKAAKSFDINSPPAPLLYDTSYQYVATSQRVHTTKPWTRAYTPPPPPAIRGGELSSSAIKYQINPHHPPLRIALFWSRQKMWNHQTLAWLWFNYYYHLYLAIQQQCIIKW